MKELESVKEAIDGRNEWKPSLPYPLSIVML
jgi:hypothetical protein